MPRVQVPAYGTYVDFPDGTPPEQMHEVLTRQFPKREETQDAAPSPPATAEPAPAPTPSPMSSLAEIAKAPVRGLLNVAESVAGAINANQANTTGSPSLDKILYGDKVTTPQSKAQEVQGLLAPAQAAVAPHPDLASLPWYSPTRILSVLGESSPAVAATAGSAIATEGATVPALVAGAIGSADQLQKGNLAGDVNAGKKAVAAGAVDAATTALPLHVIGKIASPYLKAAAGAGGMTALNPIIAASRALLTGDDPYMAAWESFRNSPVNAVNGAVAGLAAPESANVKAAKGAALKASKAAQEAAEMGARLNAHLEDVKAKVASGEVVSDADLNLLQAHGEVGSRPKGSLGPIETPVVPVPVPQDLSGPVPQREGVAPTSSQYPPQNLSPQSDFALNPALPSRNKYGDPVKRNAPVALPEPVAPPAPPDSTINTGINPDAPAPTAPPREVVATRELTPEPPMSPEKVAEINGLVYGGRVGKRYKFTNPVTGKTQTVLDPVDAMPSSAVAPLVHDAAPAVETKQETAPQRMPWDSPEPPTPSPAFRSSTPRTMKGSERGAANLGAVAEIPGAVKEKVTTAMHGGYTPEQWQAHVDTNPRAHYIETALGRPLMEMARQTKKAPAALAANTYRALTGDAAAKQLLAGTPLGDAVSAFRKHLDDSSAQLEALIRPYDPETADTIKNNMGQWVNRSYRIFDYADGKVGDWIKEAKKLPQWSNAVSEFGGEKNLADFIYGLHEGGVDAVAFGSVPSKVATQLLKARKQLSPSLRAVLGEIKDPIEASAKSIVNNARLIAKAEFQNKIFESVKNDVYPDRASAPSGYKQIPESNGYGPLSGKFVNPDFHAAFTAMTEPMKKVGWGGAALNAFLGYTKAAKTVLNVPVGLVKQVPANEMMKISNGDFGALMGVNAFTQGKQPFADYFLSRLDGTRFATKKAMSEVMRAIMEKGLLDSHPVAQEIAGNAKAALSRTKAGNAAVNIGSKVMRGFSEIYSSSDNLAKIHAVVDKMAQYKDSNQTKGFTTKQLADFAAQRVQDEYPNSVRISQWVRQWQKNPLSAAFVGYNAEAFRTRAMSLRNMATDFKAGDTAIASRKMVGNAALLGLIPAVAAGTKAYYGITPDKEKAIEAGLPQYTQGHAWASGGGNTAIDISYLNPDPQVAAMNQVMMGRPLGDTIVDLGKNYLGGSIPAQGIIDYIRNETSTGAPVYPEKATSNEKFWALMDKAVIDPATPGFINELQRSSTALTGEKYHGYPVTPANELGRLTTGLTAVESKPIDKTAQKIRDFSGGWNSEYNSKVRAGKSPAQAMRETNEQRKEAHAEIADVIKAMRKSGTSLVEIRGKMKALGVDPGEVDKFIKPYKAYRGPGR